MADAPNRKLEDVAIKTLAGFANRVGGTLLIGVADDGTIGGLIRDYACPGWQSRQDATAPDQSDDQPLRSGLSRARIRIAFPEHDGAEVCRIDIDRVADAGVRDDEGCR